MNFDKYTDRSRGFVQSAQSLAQREGYQSARLPPDFAGPQSQLRLRIRVTIGGNA